MDATSAPYVKRHVEGGSWMGGPPECPRRGEDECRNRECLGIEHRSAQNIIHAVLLAADRDLAESGFVVVKRGDLEALFEREADGSLRRPNSRITQDGRSTGRFFALDRLHAVLTGSKPGEAKA
ncbi:MAG: hypothetical protein LC623_05425 [Halobacteriales archaeon]|nr:hypothetical protein [Halobacteriales archaeon]